MSNRVQPDELTYTPGQIVNGHRLSENGEWVALGVAEAIEAQVADRIGADKTTGWVLWFLLGGLGAHLAHLYPKSRLLILVCVIVGGLCTFGVVSLFCWLLTWPLLLGSWSERAAMHRAELMNAALVRRQLDRLDRGEF